MNQNHNKWMKHCLKLAEKGLGKVAPNPMVGCVIVLNEQVIGEGFHEVHGGPHAEVNAITQIKDQSLIPDATLYVNLEPCAHQGKTPPCANLIVKKGFKKVVIGALDNNEKVAGKGVKLLEEAGINVTFNVLEKECYSINEYFYHFHQYKRPYYLLKWAETNDGFIYNPNYPKQISNASSALKVHEIRAKTQAILIGKNTLLTDNPSLTVRLTQGTNPVKIIIANHLNDEIYQTKAFNSGTSCLVFNTETSKKEGALEFIRFASDKLIASLNEELYKRGIQAVLVEGGTNILQQFINANAWDKMIRIKGTTNFSNGIKAPKFQLRPTSSETFDGDIWETYLKQNR